MPAPPQSLHLHLSRLCSHFRRPRRVPAGRALRPLGEKRCSAVQGRRARRARDRRLRGAPAAGGCAECSAGVPDTSRRQWRAPSAPARGGHGRNARAAAEQARCGSHLAPVTAAARAPQRLAAGQSARVGSWSPAAGSGACLRARSAAVTRPHRRLSAIALVFARKKKKKIRGTCFVGLAIHSFYLILLS